MKWVALTALITGYVLLDVWFGFKAVIITLIFVSVIEWRINRDEK